jgi:hypothetical protein
MESQDDQNLKLEWTVSVPIFHNVTILKQLGLAIGVPFGLLILVLFLSSNDRNRIYALYAVGLIVALLVLTYLFIMLFHGGKYDAGFVLDDKGVLCYTQRRQAVKNSIVNGLVVVFGLLSGKPAVAGAGILAGTKNRVFLKWSKVSHVKYDHSQQVVMLRGGLTENIAVFCTPENYALVEATIRRRLKSGKSKDAGSLT